MSMVEDTDSDFTEAEAKQFAQMQSGGEVDVPEPSGDQQVTPEPDGGDQQVVQKTENDQQVAPVVDEVADEVILGADDKPVVDKEGKPQKRVSFHKYRRTEERANQLQTDLEKRNADFIRVEERLRILNEALATPQVTQQQEQQDEDPEPDPEKDIFAHNQWLKRQLGTVTKTVQELRSERATEREEITMARDYRAKANEYATKEPNFGHAYAFLIRQRLVELEQGGMADPKARAQKVVAEEKNLVRSALAEGVNPAERLFNMAKTRGFVPPAAQQQPAAGGQQQQQKDPNALDGKGAAAKPAGGQQEAKKPSVTEVIQQIKDGQQASHSLSNGAGGDVPQLTASMLADMPQEEFDEMVARLPASQVRALLGG